ncbi:MAG: hypothetical protein RL291_1144, partial [Pseudomonadota bacterium]
MTATHAPAAQPSALALLKSAPAFRRLVASRGLSVLALTMLTTAVGWQIYEATGSALLLGLVAFAQFVPLLIFTPIIGYVVDRYDRRRIAALCQTTGAAITALMAMGISAGALPPTALIVIMGIVGILRAFEFPSMSALVALTVERQELARATAIYS